ncbi:MAG: hypothetical protein JW940_24940 [Polyangiaceae bacterium]|nr:hypothetical protein [Polyangiaceae bacterium]
MKSPLARSVLLSCAMLAALAGNGCSKGKSSEGNASSPPENERQTVIRVGEDEYVSALLSVVDVEPDNDAIAPLLGITGFKDNVGLSLGTVITTDQVASGSLKASLVRLSDGPLVPGKANFMLQNQSHTVLAEASSGTVELKLGGGRVSGTVQAVPESLSASIEAAVSVGCWVASGLLPDAGQPGGSRLMDENGNDVTLVVDTEFSTPGCAPWKGLVSD